MLDWDLVAISAQSSLRPWSCSVICNFQRRTLWQNLSVWALMGLETVHHCLKDIAQTGRPSARTFSICGQSECTLGMDSFAWNSLLASASSTTIYLCFLYASPTAYGSLCNAMAVKSGCLDGSKLLIKLDGRFAFNFWLSLVRSLEQSEWHHHF